MELLERYKGALLGLAAGDAVGTTVEFQDRGSFIPLTDMVGGGPFELKVGEWTDDTSMALCLAESLIEKNGLDAKDQMERYCCWYRKGYLSSNGECFDIGNTVRDALSRFMMNGKAYSGSTDKYSAGNGSIMRLAAVPMFFYDMPEVVMEKCGLSSRTTHGAEEAIDACRYFGGLILGALLGATKEEILAPLFCPVEAYWQKNLIGVRRNSLTLNIRKIAEGHYKTKNVNDICGSGYVVRSLEAALWCFYNSDSFKEGCLMAANLGDDADTTAAVYGQLAGAYYGESAIPQHWRDQLARRELIEEFSLALMPKEKEAPSK